MFDVVQQKVFPGPASLVAGMEATDWFRHKTKPRNEAKRGCQ